MKNVLGVKENPRDLPYEAEPGTTRCAKCRGVDGHYAGCCQSQPGDVLIIRNPPRLSWPEHGR